MNWGGHLLDDKRIIRGERTVEPPSLKGHKFPNRHRAAVLFASLIPVSFPFQGNLRVKLSRALWRLMSHGPMDIVSLYRVK